MNLTKIVEFIKTIKTASKAKEYTSKRCPHAFNRRQLFKEVFDVDDRKAKKLAESFAPQLHRLLFPIQTRYQELGLLPKCKSTAILSKTEKYSLMTDNEIINEVIKYKDWAALSVDNESLRKVVDAFKLRNEVIKKKPSFCSARHYRGLSGIAFKSQFELMMGNLLFLNQIEFDYDKNLEFAVNKRKCQTDFHIPKFNLFIEICGYKIKGQSPKDDRNKDYASKMEQKASLYKAFYPTENILLIKAGTYINHRMKTFYNKEIVTFAKSNNLVLPTFEKCMSYNHEEFDAFSTMRTKGVVDYIIEQGGWKEVSNHQSSLITFLKQRPDFEVIHQKVKRQSNIIRSINANKSRQKNKELRLKCQNEPITK